MLIDFHGCSYTEGVGLDTPQDPARSFFDSCRQIL